MKVFNITCALLLLLPLKLCALTVNEMAQQTLDTDPQINQRISELRSMKYDLDKAYAGYKPSLDLEGGAGPQKTDRQGPGIDQNNNLFATEASLTLTENLFQGFNTKYDVKEQEARIEAAKYFTLQEADTILLKLVNSYLDIVKNKQVFNIEYENVKNHERIDEMIRQKTQAGLGTRADVEQSQARKALAYSNYIVQQNNYRDSVINFERLYGKVVLADEMPDAMQMDLPTYDLEELIKLALKYNPTIKTEEFNVNTQTSKYSKEVSSFYPTVDAVLSVDYRKNTDGYEYDTKSAKAMLKLKYNLYNGNRDESIRLQNLEATTAQRYNLNASQRAVIEKLKLAFMSYIHTKKRIKCLELYVKVSKKTTDSYAQEYYLGRRTLLDLLNVEQEHITAQKELINAKNEMYMALYRVLDSIGIMSSVLNTNMYDALELETPELPGHVYGKKMTLKDIKDDVQLIDLDKICEEAVDLSIVEPKEEKVDETSTHGIIIDKTDEQNTKIDLVDIKFEYKSSKLSKESKEHLKPLAKRMLEDKDIIMEIHGHTDNIGSEKYNKKLSLARAKSAQKVLVANGVKAERIKIFGHAFNKPAATNKTAKGRALNRRIEFVLEKAK